jgi:hypothetical protein
MELILLITVVPGVLLLMAVAVLLWPKDKDGYLIFGKDKSAAK